VVHQDCQSYHVEQNVHKYDPKKRIYIIRCVSRCIQRRRRRVGISDRPTGQTGIV